ncbi:MAG: orotidine-5'-phosphate decarboxylase [Gemmatimonadetes bacterium]|uniref:Orotidine 5'-phosphate decarboxylase n=1 Tax=Candidatus Kutchimonas denitrificans TaxID=3056748 RepID=A0AAE4ZCN3_9BACT|nr:orotidine-5'-phosphate decarboxylase [Gemmatimonadota bacterium]NIR75355.1 orotidine-5'-phosphate decarboxylase [Candidatus Kutchimonas denitrificans]NIS00997.1 orotidine-5'-phosphate decarboxylase [Gemmatimonadota bacterium]NIT66621.1 orotidine-5'-phosphate decarboxylase [Gemmatimonadota bacterium]NIU53201.1 orotidine-5'-phosphate decarboxylase [Gemmatimonadota bacterium]
MSDSTKDRVIIALDVPTRKAALELVEKLGEDADFYKVGAQLFSESGPTLLDELKKRGKRVFLDLKYHDIPNTVAGAVRAAAKRDVQMLTVHAAGGVAMLTAAVEAAGADGPAIVAVTLLTSLRTEDVEQVFGRSPLSLVDEVVRLAGIARAVGLPAVVASPTEVKPIKRSHGDGLEVVTPGIRLIGDAPGDQSRYATPADAARAGADYIVVGRSVTQAKDPAKAFEEVVASFSGGG